MLNFPKGSGKTLLLGKDTSDGTAEMHRKPHLGKNGILLFRETVASAMHFGQELITGGALLPLIECGIGNGSVIQLPINLFEVAFTTD